MDAGKGMTKKARSLVTRFDFDTVADQFIMREQAENFVLKFELGSLKRWIRQYLRFNQELNSTE